MSRPGTFIWNELVTPDQSTAGPFYSQLFGWERHEVDAGPWGIYTIFRQDGNDVAGMMNPTASEYAGSSPPRWVAYIAVADADAIAGHVPKLGGKVIEQPHDIPGAGRVGVFTDPTGALVYIMQPQADVAGDSEPAS